MGAIDLMDRYPEDVRHHCYRVAKLVFDAIVAFSLDDSYYASWMQIALMHDILEDTDTKLEELPESIQADIVILTRRDDETYFEYIDRIRTSGSTRAILVKKMDIVDHLEQADTLKDSLKDRYLKALDMIC